MMFGQILGAITSMYVFFELLSRYSTDKADPAGIKSKDFPHLARHTETSLQCFGIEAFCTFIFVSSVLLVKDEVSTKYVSHVAGEGINFLGCALIALTLCSMILMSGPHTSGSLNPAVSISLTMLENGPLKDINRDVVFWNVYMAGPFTGALFAGIASWVHSAVLEAFGPDAVKEEVKQNEPEVKKTPADNEAVRGAEE